MEEATIQWRLAQTVRSRREALKVSQETFADSIGMHRAYYSSIERGERNITVETLGRLADGLRVSIAALAKEAGV